MDLGLNGRRVLVVGGSEGIGYTTAKQFLEEGCSVVIVGRNEEKLKAAVKQLSAVNGNRITGRSGDLSKSGTAESLADAYPGTDILVNNAGPADLGDILAVDEARWREAWDLKPLGYVNMMRAMYRHMRGHPPKVIVNVMGIIADHPTWHYICGHGANVALSGMTKSMGGRSVDEGVRVVGVNPGAVETEFWRRIHMGRAKKMLGDAARWRDVIPKDYPFGRPATQQEVANVIVFLASDRASYVSGEVLNVDGGMLHRQGLF